jgi:hypothetical protein
MMGLETPIFDQGAIQFMLFVVMILVVAVITWLTIAK